MRSSSYRLREQFLISHRIKPYDQCSTLLQSWRPEISGWPQEKSREGFFARLFVPQINVNNVLSLADVDFIYVADNGQSLLFIEPGFSGVHLD